MEPEEFESLLQLFKVIGNESRLRIVGLLANQERSVGELATLLDLKEPTVSHHLALMKNLGLVTVEAVGNVRIHRLNAGFLERMSKELFSKECLADLADSVTGDAWERKVLRSFLDGLRIKEIPAQHKKQLVILRWLVEKFEFGVKYSEREVNEIIKQHHPDTAWFRRSMIDRKLMARKKGVYWRLSNNPRAPAADQVRG